MAQNALSARKSKRNKQAMRLHSEKDRFISKQRNLPAMDHVDEEAVKQINKHVVEKINEHDVEEIKAQDMEQIRQHPHLPADQQYDRDPEYYQRNVTLKQPRVGFRDLSREIRDMIYHELAHSGARVPVVLDIMAYRSEWYDDVKLRTSPPNDILALCGANKQCLNEVTHHAIQHGLIHLKWQQTKYTPRDSPSSQYWMESLGHKIRNMHVSYPLTGLEAAGLELHRGGPVHHGVSLPEIIYRLHSLVSSMMDCVCNVEVEAAELMAYEHEETVEDSIFMKSNSFRLGHIKDPDRFCINYTLVDSPALRGQQATKASGSAIPVALSRPERVWKFHIRRKGKISALTYSYPAPVRNGRER